MSSNTISLSEAANVLFLTPTDISFFKNGDFVGAKLTINDTEKMYDRVWFHRSFPFDLPDKFISVQNSEKEEIGLIRELNAFDSNSIELINAELERKYYTPKILKIISIKETRGFSYWKVICDAGEISFTLQDTYRSISRIGNDRAFILDVSGNRFEIESLEKLEPKSRRKIEIYL